MPVFRRRIELAARHAPEGGQVRIVLEDDFHHFRVALSYRDGVICALNGAAPRHPFSVCPGATAELVKLVGMPLARIANAVTQHTDASEQCTHLLDLAGLANAAAARGITYRRYELEVPRYVAGRSHARLVRDDGFELEWEINGSDIVAPVRYAKVNLRRGMARWALATLPEEEAEAALVLRRGALIGYGRSLGLHQGPHTHLRGSCYAHQPQRAEQAIRLPDSTWDFTERAEALCLDDGDWLKVFETV